MSQDPSAFLDQARAVRSEDAIDVEALDHWIRGHVDGLGVGLPEVGQYPKGASNLTYVLNYPNRRLVMRRPPMGHKARSAHDMGREYRIQKALAATPVAVPEMLALCDDESIIGSEFYVMAHVEGLILRSRLPEGLALTPARAEALCQAAVDELIALHSVDTQAAGLDQLGKGAGYNRRQIEGWSGRFRKARTWNVGKGEKVMAWLDAHCPDEVGLCMIHGDYRLDNLVLEPNLDQANAPIGVKAILDWELATIGDPLMDLGNAMAYWVQGDDDFYFKNFRRQPTDIAGMWRRDQVVAYYCAQRGLSADQWAFYEVYGLFRLAVIAQQIYYRYHHKQTTNRQFRHLWTAVNYLLWRCQRIIRRQGR